MEIAGIHLDNGGYGDNSYVGWDSDFHDYESWEGSEKQKNGSTLGVTATPSKGDDVSFAENRNVERILFSLELRDEDEDFAIDPADKIVRVSMNELDREKAEWVIGVIRKEQSPSKIQTELAKPDWVVKRLSELRR